MTNKGRAPELCRLPTPITKAAQKAAFVIGAEIGLGVLDEFLEALGEELFEIF